MKTYDCGPKDSPKRESIKQRIVKFAQNGIVKTLATGTLGATAMNLGKALYDAGHAIGADPQYVGGATSMVGTGIAVVGTVAVIGATIHAADKLAQTKMGKKFVKACKVAGKEIAKRVKPHLKAAMKKAQGYVSEVKKKLPKKDIPMEVYVGNKLKGIVK